ncbi:MAG: deoxyuridine 5'-triphosphate nucleotidohydrolase [Elusimicrobia bacterium RIFOXYC2_FULL_34_12]|nr:MAG: deoxyuridine 5'-triphosphate nucleotidohydrolase [Elusimicrobia bacterium RIFOXYC2_FULL_34_12]OGS38988.1 MAG: deoxyuridine 5'-triphosphate nucleotidohydrolase [Elusimicrobia bacterium RIFOXYD2_FULL_34_30]HAM38709.1 dUTP diphosphatase [Elusimicrobiota bacterium]
MQVKVLRLQKNIKLPQYQHNGDSCVDLINAGEDISIKPLSRHLIPTGLKVSIPDGYELQVRPRSGLAIKKGITVLNTPGTIDSGYRGEICVIIYNSSNETVEIKTGERVAQMALCKVEKISWEEVDDLDITVRSEGGFGSTGTHG